MLAALAACATTPGEIPAAPGRVEASAAEPGTARSVPAAGPCLFVFNHADAAVAVYAGGRHLGWVGPRSSAGLPAGRSAGARTELVAVGGDRTWRRVVTGPPWNLSWHLDP